MLHLELCLQIVWIKTLVSSVILDMWICWKILRICAPYSIPDRIMFSRLLLTSSRGHLNISLSFHAPSAQTHHHSSETDPLSLLLILVRLVDFQEFSLSLPFIYCVFSPPFSTHLGRILQIRPFVSVPTTLGQMTFIACLNYC